MPLQKVSFSVTGEKQYSRAFEAMAHEVQDMSEPFEEIGRSLISHVHDQFRTEGGAGSFGKWKPLNPDYERWKREQVGDQPILVFTGQTRSKVTDPGAITISPRKFVYDPDSEIADRHQSGEDHLPQRKIVDLPDSLKRSWDRVFVNWLQAKRSIL